MRKILLLILSSVFIFNTTNASNYSCDKINSEINNYSEYKTKIDDLFTIISEKNQKIQTIYYKKLDKITSKYLNKIDIENNRKLYIVVSYIKCENENNRFKKKIGGGPELLYKKEVLNFLEGEIVEEKYDGLIKLFHKGTNNSFYNEFLTLEGGDYITVNNFKFFENQKKVFFSVQYAEMAITQVFYLYDIEKKRLYKVGSSRFINNKFLKDSTYGFTSNNSFYQCIFDGIESYSITVSDENLDTVKEIIVEINSVTGEYDDIISKCTYNKLSNSIKYTINGEQKEYNFNFDYSKIINSYYGNIQTGKLEKAYSMKYKPSISLEKFKKQYNFDGKVNINTSNHKRIGDSKYSFVVDIFYEKTGITERYKTTMQIIDSKLKTISVNPVKKEVIEETSIKHLYYGSIKGLCGMG